MNNLKRVLCAILTCSILLMLLLTGCGKDKDSTKKEASGTVATKEEIKKVTLKWMTLSPGKQVDADKVWEAFNKKLGSYLPNTTVEFYAVDSAEYGKKWQLAAASGEVYDIAWTGWMIPYAPEVNKGSYMELDTLIDKYAPALRTDIPSWLLARGRVNGKTYSVPCYQNEAQFGHALYAPKELADKYMNIQKIMEVNKNAKSRTKECYDVIEQNYLKPLKDNNLLQKGAGNMWFMMYKNTQVISDVKDILCYRLDDPNFTVMIRPETEDYKTYLEVKADWFEKGYIRKDILTMTGKIDDDNFKAGGYSVWTGSQSGSEIGMKPGNTTSNTVDTITVPLDDVTKARIAIGSSTTSLTIPRTSTNPDRAIQLIELMYGQKSKDIYNLLVYGLEGDHYKKISENRIETLDYSGSASAKSKYGLFKWALGNSFNAFDTQADKEGANANLKKITESATPDKLMGISFDTSSISTEITKIAAIIEEYRSIESGVLKDYQKRYDEYIAKLKNAGVDKVKSEIQKQINDYVKANNIK